MEYKSVRVWTLRRSLPASNFVECPSPPPSRNQMLYCLQIAANEETYQAYRAVVSVECMFGRSKAPFRLFMSRIELCNEITIFRFGSKFHDISFRSSEFCSFSQPHRLNRFSSVPAVFTFFQAVQAPTPNLSPISR